MCVSVSVCMLKSVLYMCCVYNACLAQEGGRGAKESETVCICCVISESSQSSILGANDRFASLRSHGKNVQHSEDIHAREDMLQRMSDMKQRLLNMRKEIGLIDYDTSQIRQEMLETGE